MTGDKTLSDKYIGSLDREKLYLERDIKDAVKRLKEFGWYKRHELFKDEDGYLLFCTEIDKLAGKNLI